MSQFVEDLSPMILKDWMNYVLGKKIGNGIGRQVFVFELNPKWVVKVEQSGYQNVIEYEMWKAAKGTKYAKWFAPIEYMSGMGSVLLQQRTLPAPRRAYPKRMPVFLGDYKYSNYGLLGGRLVCHDYGSAIIASNGLNGKMRKADWWDAGDGSSFDDSK